jgi:peptidyl-tRNA hydrolase, PTH1 family
MDALWIVVGLGNPGEQYAGNRHNVGFMVVEALGVAADSLCWRSSRRFEAELAMGPVQGHALLLVKPQSYMNLSGRAVGPLAQHHRVPPERIVAVHDDVDLELGRLKLKAGGGDGGHKGIRSMTEALGSPDFFRVRFGVGRPEEGQVTDHVLRDFEESEREELEQQVERAGQAALAVMARGLKEAMNRFNRGPRKRGASKDDRDEQKRAQDKQQEEQTTQQEDCTSSEEPTQ